MIIEWELEQGSDAWLDARCGVVSASKFGEIFTPTGKKATGQKVENFTNTMIAERITGKPTVTFKSDAMERGNELEAEARSYYEMAKGVDVVECGLVYLNDDKKVSCSPDGLILHEPYPSQEIIGGVEIKCPLAHTHVKYLLNGKIPTQYIPQVQGSMHVCDVDTWDFMSYHPDLKPLILTIERDQDWIDKFVDVLNPFLESIDVGQKMLTEKKAA